jgi:hypothetical protein
VPKDMCAILKREKTAEKEKKLLLGHKRLAHGW